MFLLLRAASIIAIAAALRADVTLSMDILGTGEGIQPPPGVLIVDVYADLTPGDEWTAAGIRGQAVNGARLLYLNDPNDGSAIVVNPGAANRFVTSFSRPRARDAIGRFENSQAGVAGGYCPVSAPPGTFRPTEINAAWYSIPTGTGSDGYVARIALDVNRLACTYSNQFEIHLIGGEPSNASPVFLSRACNQSSPGTASATFQEPALSGWSWGVFLVQWPPRWCEADFDCDREVGVSDLAILLASFGVCDTEPNYNPLVDMNLDNCVNIRDLALFLSQFGFHDYPLMDCY